MALSFNVRLVFLTGVLLVGCRPSPPTPPVTNIASPQPATVVSPQPQFENWRQFPVGTKVVRRKVVTNPNGTVVETETLKLVSKNEEAVEVETQIHVKRHDGTEVNNPPQTWKYPATFRRPETMPLAQFQLPSLKAKKVGQEQVLVGMQEFTADVYEWTETNEAGPMTVKLLFCDSFPGHKIRQEMFTEQTQTQSVETIAELDKK